MRLIRLLALGIAGFIVSFIAAFFTSGTWLNRAIASAMCTVFSFNSAMCTVDLGRSSERVVAAIPPAVEKTMFDGLGNLLVQRSREFDDDQPINSPPVSNPQAPSFPQDPGTNFTPRSSEFDDTNVDNAIQDAANQAGQDVQKIDNAIDEYAKQAATNSACEFMGNSSKNRLPLSNNSNYKKLNQSPVESKLCKYDGRYAVFAQHPLFPGADIIETGHPLVGLATQSSLNNELAHEHIFFCNNGKITRNVGFGPDGQFSYSNQAITTGREENGGRVDNFEPINDQLYDTDIINSVLEQSYSCNLQDNRGSYVGLGNNCQNFTERIRNRFNEKLRKVCNNNSPTSRSLKTATSWGDPHLVTFDGLTYDHHAIGEFILAKSNDGTFEVQTREAAVPRTSSVALNTAAAMKVGNTRVAFYAENFPDSDTKNPLRVNGKPTVIQGGSLSLPGGGSITQLNQSSYLVQWPTGEQVSIETSKFGGSGYVNVNPGLPESRQGQIVGLLGNFNGNQNDDFKSRNGQVLQPQSSIKQVSQIAQGFANWIPIPLNQVESAYLDQLHKQFGDSWRISQSESLFDYAPGKNTESFTNRAFPNGYQILRMLLPQQVQMAEKVCRDAGVPAERLEGCLFDVGATGNADFAKVAANMATNFIKKQLNQQIQQNLPIPLKIPGLSF